MSREEERTKLYGQDNKGTKTKTKGVAAASKKGQYDDRRMRLDRLESFMEPSSASCTDRTPSALLFAEGEHEGGCNVRFADPRRNPLCEVRCEAACLLLLLVSAVEWIVRTTFRALGEPCTRRATIVCAHSPSTSLYHPRCRARGTIIYQGESSLAGGLVLSWSSA